MTPVIPSVTANAIDWPDVEFQFVAAIKNGTAGADVLIGTSGPDLIDGRSGNDQIYGRAGADVLIGGPGDDVIDGGASFEPSPPLTDQGFNDECIGGPGHDVNHVDGRKGYSNGDGDNDGDPFDDVKHSDITIVHRGHTTGDATLINRFDVRVPGKSVQDRFALAGSDSFEIDSFDIRPSSKRPDGDGWVAQLTSVTIAGEFGELVRIELETRFGPRQVYSEDGSNADAEAFLMDMIQHGWMA